MDCKQYQLTLFLGRHKTRCAGFWMYSVELINALCELVQDEREIKNIIFPMKIVFSGLDQQQDELEKIKMKYADLPIDIVRLDDFKNHRKFGVFFDFFRVCKNTKILHATSNVLPLICSGKKILTIHDLFQAYPVNTPRGIYEKFRILIYKFLFLLQFNMANIINTDLDNVADELKKRYKKLNNVCTILPGLKSVYVNSQFIEREHNYPYLLSFASSDSRKNIRRVIEAFANTHFLENIYLRIITSSNDLKEELEVFLKANNISNIEVLAQVSDIDLQEIYATSRALIFPSLAEGFGFPIYEALSQGIPVVASANLTIEQIRAEVRPFVIECDPYSCSSISNAMQRVVSLSLRVEKRKKVAEYIKNTLNFKNTAIQFVKLYSSCLK